MKIQGIIAILLIAAGVFTTAATADRQQESSPGQETLIGMPNPSAVWAEQRGYHYLIRTNPDGSQNGVCVLPDGSEHDAWELFRQSQVVGQEDALIGMPDPSAVWAEQRGYHYLTRTSPDGSQFGVCVLPDGSEHDSWRLFCKYSGILRPSGISTSQPAVSSGLLSSKGVPGQTLFSAGFSGQKP